MKKEEADLQMLPENPPLSKETSVSEMLPEGNTSKAPVFEMNSSNNKKSFIPKLVFPRVVTVVFLILLLVWIFEAEGGLGFQEATVFGFHAFFMGLFVVVFLQEGIVAFSSQSIIGLITKKRIHIKYFHAIFQIFGIICAVLGLVAIVYYKSLSGPIVFPFFTMYSPHSWVAISFLSLWVIQVGAMMYTHFVIELSLTEKVLFNKYHRALGKFIYALGLATCALGFQDMQSSDLASSSPPMSMDEMMMMNMTMTGYYPDSNLAQYSSGCCLILIFSGLATFAAFI